MEKKVASLLASMRHDKTEIKSHSLVYIPYWFFSFDIYESADSKTKVIASGFSSLNAFSKEFDHRLAYLSHSHPKKEDLPSSGPGAEVLPPKLAEEAEVKEILPVLLASRHDASKDNVIISGLEFAYVPFWRISIDAHDESVVLRMNAVTGKIINVGDIHPRGKAIQELVTETFRELSDPMQWARYSSEIISDAVGGAAKNAHAKKSRGHKGNGAAAHEKGAHTEINKTFSVTDPDTAVLLLAIAALLVAIWVFLLR